jgi:hypothetical protein
LPSGGVPALAALILDEVSRAVSKGIYSASSAFLGTKTAHGLARPGAAGGVRWWLAVEARPQ